MPRDTVEAYNKMINLFQFKVNYMNKSLQFELILQILLLETLNIQLLCRHYHTNEV